MITIPFLMGWAIRSLVLIVAGALLLWLFRVKDSRLRLAAWTAMLFGSLAIPVLMAVMPALHVSVVAPATVAKLPTADFRVASSSVPVSHNRWRLTGLDAALLIYLSVAAALLLRLGVGLAMSWRLRRSSVPIGDSSQDIELRESDAIGAPVTQGIFRAAILLPAGWRDWDPGTLDAVLAHERAHIQRRDPAVQLLSALHRALLWHNPGSWFLHSRIVRVAEEASDDAALAVTADRASYAEILLDFMRRGVTLQRDGAGVAMARYGSLDRRIHRILDSPVPVGRVARWSIAVVFCLGSPLAYVAATAQPVSRAAQTAATPAVPTAQRTATAPAVPVRKAGGTRNESYLTALGNVSAVTAVVRARVDGQLRSLNFKEGETVEAGQVMASFENPALTEEMQLARRKLHEQLANGKPNQQEEVQNRIEFLDEEWAQRVDEADVRAPIKGVVGLRRVEPGNAVHVGDPIVTIVQQDPISVLFTISQDFLPQVRARLQHGTPPVVEAWSRDNKTRIASGRLSAVDNQIDPDTGTVKLRGAFDNPDGALFPNQFVNVHLILR